MKEQLHPDFLVNSHVEQICKRGCAHVNQVISLIEQGQSPEELASLPTEYHQALATELRSIMAVYDARNEDE